MDIVSKDESIINNDKVIVEEKTKKKNSWKKFKKNWKKFCKKVKKLKKRGYLFLILMVPELYISIFSFCSYRLTEGFYRVFLITNGIVFLATSIASLIIAISKIGNYRDWWY